MAQGSVARAIAIAQRFAEASRLPKSTADRLAIVVEEWVANIVEHGQAPEASRIVLRVERASEGVRLTISDAGVAFDPREAQSSGPNPDRGGGVGLDMIRAWSRIASYRRRDGRNRLILELPLA